MDAGDWLDVIADAVFYALPWPSPQGALGKWLFWLGFLAVIAGIVYLIVSFVASR